MSKIVWGKLLEKDTFRLFIQVTKKGPDTFTFSEEGPLPPSMVGMEARSFKTEKEAIEYAEGNYIPGRRTQGWRLKDLD